METVATAQWDASGTSPELPGSGASMRQIHVKAGHVATRHSHPHEQFLYVLSGAAELQCEAGSVPLRPGTAIRFARMPGTAPNSPPTPSWSNSTWLSNPLRPCWRAFIGRHVPRQLLQPHPRISIGGRTPIPTRGE